MKRFPGRERLNQEERFQAEVMQCELCPLYMDCLSPVPGSGDWSSKIMMVGEAPGRDEDEGGEPFIGRSGELLRQTFKRCGLDLEGRVYITNTVKCRPRDNRTPTGEEANTCANQWLTQEMENVTPEAIVLLGRVAQKYVLPYAAIGEGGRIMQNGVECYYLHHPSYWGRQGQAYIKGRVAPKIKDWIHEWRVKLWV